MQMALQAVLIATVSSAAGTPLHDAVESGDAGRVEEVLGRRETKLERVAGKGGHTALHDAAFIGLPDIAQMLVKAGADLEATTWDGVTPLHLAAYAGHVKTTSRLLEIGAPINAPGLSHKDTPLHRAVGGGSLAVVKLLLDRGASMQGDKYGYTPLHTAAATGNAELAALLIERGAALDAENEEGKRPRDMTKAAEVLTVLDAALLKDEV